MADSSELESTHAKWLPSWDLRDRRPPTPDYLETARHEFSHFPGIHDQHGFERGDDGMFEISVVPSALQRSRYRPVSQQLDIAILSNPAAMQNAKSQNAAPPAKPENPFSPMRDAAFIFTVCMAQFLSLAALAQSVAPLLIIGDTFGVTDPGQLSWYTAAYSLTVGTFILPAGRLGDMYGHKKMFLFGWVWFGVWSFIAGVSIYSGSTLFNLARAFQGIGPATLVPNAMALIGRTYPVGLKKNLIFSAFGAGGPTGFVVGAVFSAIFGQLTWWPWAFWALTITCIFLLLFSLLVIPADRKRPPQTSPHGAPKFDWKGALSGVGGLVLINFAWNQGPVVGWTTPYVYSLLIVGFILMTVFFLIELYFTRFPLIPIRGLSKDAGFALACIAAGWGSHGIWIYYIWWFLLRLRNHSPLLIAAQTSPVAPVGAAFALSVGLLMKRMRPAYIMLLAMIMFLAGSLLIVTAPVDQTYWARTFVSILIMPGGMNLSFPAGTILLSNALPKENQGIAASLVSTTVNYSISLGLGFAGTVDRYVSPDPAAPGGLNILRGFRGAWWFGTGLDGLGLIIALYFVWVTRPNRQGGKSFCLKTAIQHEREKRNSKQQLLTSSGTSSDSDEKQSRPPPEA
ncbi:MAG: hypothetical protein Q9162_002966 [Coniocarpon cinnabarinum]